MHADSIRSIAEAIARQMVNPPPRADEQIGDGVFATLQEAVTASKATFHALDGLGLESRKAILASMRQVLRPMAESLAQQAVEETRLGRVHDKIQKIQLVIDKTPGTEDLTPQALSGDRGLVLIEPAPFGVIGAITPVTNPPSTIICNAIGMVAAGSAVVFNAHPSAKRVSARTVQLLNRAIVAANGPANLLTCVAEPTLESAGELMKHPLVRLLVVTGGPGVVAAAMNSGKRAIADEALTRGRQEGASTTVIPNADPGVCGSLVAGTRFFKEWRG